MPLFRREPPRLLLRMPRIDGSSWPDRRDVERRSFAALTLYEMGYREAFEPEAATIASKKEPSSSCATVLQPSCNDGTRPQLLKIFRLFPRRRGRRLIKFASLYLSRPRW